MSHNLALKLTAGAREHSRRPAVRLGEQAISYADLDDASARFAGVLREMGAERGDRVGIMIPNVPQFAVAYFGTLRAGATVVPMNVLLKRREVAFYLGDPGAKIVFAWHEFAEAGQQGAADAGAQSVLVVPGEFEELLSSTERAPEVAPSGADDTAVILYTSGTTGKPKGAELTHGSLARNAAAIVDMFSFHRDDVVLGALPLFHSFGQTCGLNATIAAGGCVMLLPRFDAEAALAAIARHRVTVFEGVPTMYSALLNHPDRDVFDVSTLRLCLSGGAALPVEDLRDFERVFGCPVLEGYGLSETSPVACFNRPDRESKPGSIGTPIDGVEMKVVDEDGNEVPQGEVGEIAIRGYNVMKGYWNRPEDTAEAIRDGWFFTGDMGRIDEDGDFFIVDRKKELIIRGGYNVYPREIEEVLYEHPAVREAAVIGVPHRELGEEVAAAVALRADADVTEVELRDYVKGQIASYKYPRHLWFVDELPKGSTGKILKREIKLPDPLKGKASG